MDNFSWKKYILFSSFSKLSLKVNNVIICLGIIWKTNSHLAACIPFKKFLAYPFFAYPSLIPLPLDKVDKTNGCITWGDAEVAAFDQNPYKDGKSQLDFIPLLSSILKVAIIL